jgi:hypothetical protein
MSDDEPPACKPDEPPDGGNLPQAGDNRRGSAQWWEDLRTTLLVLEAGCVLVQRDALATGARAIVLIGDVVFRR